MLVKLKSINIRAKSDDLAPDTVKLYINEENIDFGWVQTATPIQVFNFFTFMSFVY